MLKKINILYFAALREQTQIEQEQLMTMAIHPAELYAELQQKYGLTLSQNRLRVAVNHSFVEWETSLNDGDTIAFIPPVSGG